MTEPHTRDESHFADLLDDLLEQILNCEEPDLDAAAARHPTAAHRIREAAALASELAGRKVVSKPSLRGYEIVRELGRGGMGTVYLARQTSLDREIALKVLPHSFGLSAASRQRFLEEARALAHVKHQHIVDIHRIVDDGEMLAFEMEFVDGPSLHTVLDVLREHRRRTGSNAGLAVIADVIGVPTAQLGARNPTQFFVRMFLKIARALGAVHAAGFVHRDVKPANLLLRRDGEPVIVDFGLVRLRNLEASHAGRFVGTPVYSSPEQLRGDMLVGPASDVYSLAVTMYECLTLVTPFTGRTTTDLLQRIEVGRFPPLRRLAPDAPRDLETIIAHAMEIDPLQRYADAGAFADDLQRLLELQPIQATPVSPVRRFGKLLRRHQKPLLAAAAGALLVAIALFPWMGSVEAAARTREAAQEHVREARQHLLAIDVENLDWHQMIGIGSHPVLRATAERTQPLRDALAEYELALGLLTDATAQREHDVVGLTIWLQQLTVSAADGVTKALDSAAFHRLTEHLGPVTVREARVLAAGSHGKNLKIRGVAIGDLDGIDDQDRSTLGLLAFLGGDPGLCNLAWMSLPADTEQPLVDAELGKLLLADGMPEAAHARLLRAQRYFPGSARLLLAIADAALRLGDLTLAQHWLAQLADDPTTSLSKRRLELDLRAARGGDDDLVADYEALAAANARDPTALHRLAQLAMRRGDLREAGDRLDALLADWPEATRFRLDRARVALQQRDLPAYSRQVMGVLERDFGRDASLGASADLLEILRLGGLDQLYREGLAATGQRRAGRSFLGGEMPIRGFAAPPLTRHFATLAHMLHWVSRQATAFADRETWLDGRMSDTFFTVPLMLAQFPLPEPVGLSQRLAFACLPWFGPRIYSRLIPLLRAMSWNLHLGGWDPIVLDVVPRTPETMAAPTFGRVLLRVDDQTGDGIDEVLLGCPVQHLDEGPGRLVLVDGRSNTTLCTIAGDSAHHLFAHALAVVGDLDGDGQQDWIVGAPSGTPDEPHGRVELWSGKTHRRMAVIEGEEPGFGVSVAGLGDCDGDGCPDFAVASAPLLRNNAAQGSVAVYSGRTHRLIRTHDNDMPGVWFGACIANAGDADGDGVPDLVVGGNFGDAPGIVRLFSGRTGNTLQTWSDATTTSGFGVLVRGIGDVDGDGGSDIAVAAVRNDNHSGLDQVFVYSGRTGKRLATLTGKRPGTGFGSAIEPYGGGRGRTWLAIGVPRSRDPVAGAVRVMTLKGEELSEIVGPNAMGLFGASIATTTDQDGDGLPELFISEPHEQGSDLVLRAVSGHWMRGLRRR